MSKTDLIVLKLDKALQLLAEARDATTAKQVADLARAAEVYAKRQKLSEEALAHATAVKIDAMTLMGEFLKAVPKNTGAKGNPGGQGAKIVRSPEGTTQTPTLAQAGIGKKESQAAQALADVKEDDPELFEDIRSGKKKVVQAVRNVAKKKKAREMARKAAAAKKAATAGNGSPPFDLLCGDCLEVLPRLEPGTFRQIFADSKYNIGVKYHGKGKGDDLLPPDVYMAWVEQWMALCKPLLTPDGSLWVVISKEFAAQYAVTLMRLGYTIRNWITWYETFGENQANNFNRCSRFLFYCVVNPKKYVFHKEAVLRPSDRQLKYADKRADPDGKIWDDVWGVPWDDEGHGAIPRLTGTCKERIPEFPTQLPLALVRPVVRCASDPGDTVLDVFNGSGSFGVAALEAGRKFLGIEIDKRYVDLARQRLTLAAAAGVKDG
jgi:site-specific DNA-methyltransferase (adenine-specific)